MADLVDYHVEGAVALITIDRAPVNALNADTIAAIDDALDRAASPDIRSVVITGSKHFAAGADITRFIDTLDQPNESMASGLGDTADRLEALAKPTIAAVQGYALGGGLELAMATDFRYLSDDAKVGQPEILLGIIPGAGGTQRLPRLVGFQRAKELNLSGRQVPAEEALAMGLADKVIPRDDLIETALADAAEWARGPTLAYAAAKQAMAGGWGASLADGLMLEREAFEGLFSTDDAKAGIRAFLAKETPTFEGS